MKTVELDRIISRPEFRKVTGISRTREWDMARKGLLPPLVQVGEGNPLGYRASDVNAWLQANVK